MNRTRASRRRRSIGLRVRNARPILAMFSGSEGRGMARVEGAGPPPHPNPLPVGERESDSALQSPLPSGDYCKTRRI